MKERGILFNAEMVNALLDDRKMQSRRPFLVAGQTIISTKETIERFDDGSFHYMSTAGMSGPYTCPFGQIGDRLYVRETWRVDAFGLYGAGRYGAYVDYHASPKHRMFVDLDYSYQEKLDMWYEKHDGDRYSPSIHMPRWASRINLEIVDIRVERIQDITEEDARDEGSDSCDISTLDNTEIRLLDYPCKAKDTPYKNGFSLLWESIYKNWNDNPWVWVVELKLIKTEGEIV